MQKLCLTAFLIALSCSLVTAMCSLYSFETCSTFSSSDDMLSFSMVRFESIVGLRVRQGNGR